jgi:hypothetical protein
MIHQPAIVYVASSSQLTAYAAFGGAVAVVVAAMIAGAVAMRNHRRTILIETVTAERAKWRSDLRRETARLSSLVHRKLDGKCVDLAAFHKTRVEILLRINPKGYEVQPNEGGHPLDRRILMELKALSSIVAMPPAILAVEPTSACAKRSIDQLEVAVQRILKQEWEVSKDEAQTGELKR